MNGNLAEEARKMQEKFHEIDDKLVLAVVKGNHKLITAQDKMTRKFFIDISKFRITEQGLQKSRKPGTASSRRSY